MKNVDQKVIEIICCQVGLTYGRKIDPEDRIIEDLGADSLDLIEIVMAIEEEFELEIRDDELEGVQTVQEAIDIVKKLYA